MTDEQQEQHAPVAEEAQDVIVGDNGLREGQPIPSDTFNPNAVLQGSQPPQAQSGVPLDEDKAAGVQPNPEMSGMVAPPHETAVEEQRQEAQAAAPEGETEPVQPAE